MNKIFFAIMASFALLQQTEALLPPLYHSLSEIKAILSDDQIGKKLDSGELIVKIEKIDKGYEIFTNKHRIVVLVSYERLDYPGPAKFKLTFQHPQPL